MTAAASPSAEHIAQCDIGLYRAATRHRTMAWRTDARRHRQMIGQLSKEMYIDTGPGDPAQVERVCAHATNRATNDVVAVAVTPDNVAQAVDLLFGTGIGIVSSIIDPRSDLIGQARRSVAKGATEIALPPLALNQAAVLTRLRSRLGAFTPVTIGIEDAAGGLDLAAAEQTLRLGADYVSYAPGSMSLTATEDITRLITLAHELQLGGVKITAPTNDAGAWFQPDVAATAARLRVPLSVGGR